MEADSAAKNPVTKGMRPCDFCGHLVEIESVDEFDCPMCGEPPEEILRPTDSA